MSSSSLDARLISSPLAALSMVATSSLEGRDLYFLSSEHGLGGTASAPVSHAGSGPPSPSSGPVHMDDLGYYQHHRKRKCTTHDASSNAPEHYWSPKTRSPLVPHAAIAGHEGGAEDHRLPSLLQVAGAGQHQAEDAYPSPRLPAMLSGIAGERREGSLPPPAAQSGALLPPLQPLPQHANGLASLLNPTDAATMSAATSSPPPIAPNTGVTTRQRPELHNPSVTRRALASNGGPLDYSRLSSSPTPSSPGHDSNYGGGGGGNESPHYIGGSVDGGSRPATPTPSTQHLTPDERKRRRLERNRLAARECRQKKKMYVQELEDRMDRMEGENQRLRKEIKELNAKLTLGSMHLDRRGIITDHDSMAVTPPTPYHSADAATLGTGGADGSTPTPPSSSGHAFALHHHHHQAHIGVDTPPRHTASPVLPALVAPSAHGRPHSNSWSPI